MNNGKRQNNDYRVHTRGILVGWAKYRHTQHKYKYQRWKKRLIQNAISQYMGEKCKYQPAAKNGNSIMSEFSETIKHAQV